jgi:hypothetical protein
LPDKLTVAPAHDGDAAGFKFSEKITLGKLLTGAALNGPGNTLLVAQGVLIPSRPVRWPA